MTETRERSDRPWALWRRWVLANILGELGGFGVAAMVGAASAWLIGDNESALANAIMIGIMVLTGAIEGTAVGWAQWRVLRRVLPELPRRAWMLATILGAVVAWAIGMTAGVSMGSADVTETTAMMVMGLLIPVFGTILGFGQWLVFRRYVERAGWWILANAAAWTIGMVVIFAGMSLPLDEEAVILMALIGILSGVLAGALVGAIHGLVLIWLLSGRLTETPHDVGLQPPGR
jgi:hypothetical protein